MRNIYDVSDYRLEPDECRECCRYPYACSHAHCHEHMEHAWQNWSTYPPCEYCEEEMIEEWAEEIGVAA